jgi:molybdopterin-guanine dinucleotide biosynthesis protein A
MPAVEAVILAGGRSSRMGRDKSLLPFGGKNSLAEYQYRRLEKIFPRVSISAKRNKFDFSPRLIPDLSDTCSPMIALEAILKSTDSRAVFLLGVDMPMISEEVIKTLLDQYEREIIRKSPPSILAAETAHGIEPLCAVYPADLLPVVSSMISGNEHRLRSLLQRCRTKTIFFDSPDLFANLNRPEEYKKALLSFG